MKKIITLLVSALFLQSCSVPPIDIGSLLQGQSAATSTILSTPQRLIFATSTRTPTITPTRPTPTFTGTPTFINSLPQPTSTETPMATSTGAILSTSQATLVPIQQLLTSQSPAFDRILVSGNQILWGTCQPASVKISVHATNSSVTSILLFTRLQATLTSFSTDWNGGADMNNDGKGNFSYILTPKAISRYKDFKTALVQYQMVAYANKREIGRTQIFLNNLTISPCP